VNLLSRLVWLMKVKLFSTEFSDYTLRHGGHVVEGTQASIQNASYTFYFLAPTGPYYHVSAITELARTVLH